MDLMRLSGFCNIITSSGMAFPNGTFDYALCYSIALAPVLIRRVVILNSVTFIWYIHVVRAGPLCLLE